MKEDASFLAKTLHRYGTSESPLKRGIATSMINLLEATGSKARTEKRTNEAINNEKEALLKFLSNKKTQDTLEKLGVNRKAFSTAVFRGYPFNAGKFNSFLRAFIVLRDELREKQKEGLKLSTLKYDIIVNRMLKYEAGDSIATSDVFVTQEQLGGVSKPKDMKLYKKVKALADEKFASKSGIYRSSWIVREYKSRGGKYVGSKPKNSGLKRWFREEWVDINRPIKNSIGKVIGYKPCGRENTVDKSKYPLCRPSKRVTSKTPKTYKEISKKSLSKAKKDKSRVKGRSNIKFGV